MEIKDFFRSQSTGKINKAQKADRFQTMTDQKPKIFLSYAHEDIGMAKRIYQDLKRYGLDVWFDNESLLPGQDWENEIEKAIETSKYFLVLLSSKGMSDRGYVHKEIRLALNIFDRCPEDDIYMIPTVLVQRELEK